MSVEINTALAIPHDTDVERLFVEVQDYFERVKEGHSTAETGLARMIEHVAKSSPNFFRRVLSDAGVYVECDCWEH